MKSCVTLLILLVGELLILPATVAVAQTPDTVVWYLFAANGTTATSTANVFGDSNSLGPATGWQIASYNTNGQRVNLGAAGWPASETDTVAGRYIEFDAHPKTGHSFTVTGISFKYGAAGSTNALKGKAYYSTNGWSTQTLLNTDSAFVYPNSSAVPAMIWYSKVVNVTVTSGKTLSLRIYPFWVSSTAGSSSKYSVQDSVTISGTTLVTNAVEKVGSEPPQAFGLDQNFPNPFNPSTVIGYELPKTSSVKIAVFDILGNEVQQLVSRVQSAGYHSVTFNSQNLASGMYFYRLQAGDFTQTRKMILLK